MLDLRDLPPELAKRLLNSKEYLGYIPVKYTVIPTIRAVRAALDALKGSGTLFGVPCVKKSHCFDVGPHKDLTFFQAAKQLRQLIEDA